MIVLKQGMYSYIGNTWEPGYKIIVANYTLQTEKVQMLFPKGTSDVQLYMYLIGTNTLCICTLDDCTHGYV